MGTNFYLEWRQHRPHCLALREQPARPDERLLQAIWHHQRLRRNELRLVDGCALRVLHPGFLNHEAGPDFRNAVVQIEGEAPRSGDIEVDLESSGWHSHGHDRNPAFQQVILHVVWETGASPTLPTLHLRPVVDAPLDELACWLGTDAAEGFPEDLLGQCAAPLRDLTPDKMTELLRQAALARLQRKAADLEARARQAGWEQALWEGLLRALGYKHNTWPMLRLGELRPVLGGETSLSPLAWQARLFGASGLLPAEPDSHATEVEGYLRELWHIWWRERDRFAEQVLPVSLWRLHGLRPANHPLRRLALAAHWWSTNELLPRLEKWFTTTIPDRSLCHSLVEAFCFPVDDFWSWHWTLRSRRLSRAQPMAGPARVTDLAINVLLPWFWARARLGQNVSLAQEAERRFLAWPSAQDNSILSLARQRLLGGILLPPLVKSAALQQGLLQIVRDFCDHADALCLGCHFPSHLAGYAHQHE